MSNLETAVRSAVEKRCAESDIGKKNIVCEILMNKYAQIPGFAPTSWEDRPKVEQTILEDSETWSAVDFLLASADAAVAQRRLPWSFLPPRSHFDQGDAGKSLQMDLLEETASTYQRSAWALSPLLEMWIVRQMIFAETAAFHRESHDHFRQGGWVYWLRLGKNLFRWVIGFFVAIGVANYYEWPVGVLAYVCWISVSRYLASDQIKALRQMVELRASMSCAYILATRIDPSPVEVSDALRRAETKGAIWPQGLRALVQRALVRDSVLWK